MRRLRKQAKELLHMASKVYHYRRDVVPEACLVELEKSVSEVESMRKDASAEPGSFEAALGRLDVLLHKVGGKIYPKTFFSDNLEVLLVAAILVLGVRTFFFQPFIIPTNSMYPTYNGMTYKIYSNEDPSPSTLQMVFNKAKLGAKYVSLVAQNSGELSIPIVGRKQNGDVVFCKERVKGRKWLFLPAQLDEYVFYIDKVEHVLRVPADFGLDNLLLEAFSSAGSGVGQSKLSKTGFVWKTGAFIEQGAPILRFDINLGDALFVDRVSYHFRRPKVGEPFVFHTREINNDSNKLGEKYFIKRIAGVGGETLEIKEGALLADGKARDEVEAFVRNAANEGEYNGYMNRDLLAEGRQLPIPENSFVALGDNSGDSNDSRSWGLVPDKSVIGKAIFIYYPFTKRWGLAE